MPMSLTLARQAPQMNCTFAIPPAPKNNTGGPKAVSAGGAKRWNDLETVGSAEQRHHRPLTQSVVVQFDESAGAQDQAFERIDLETESSAVAEVGVGVRGRVLPVPHTVRDGNG